MKVSSQVSLTLYKPSKNYKRGTRTCPYSLSPTKQLELLSPDLSFGGMYLDHPFGHPFVQDLFHLVSFLLDGFSEKAQRMEEICLTSIKLNEPNSNWLRII